MDDELQKLKNELVKTYVNVLIKQAEIWQSKRLIRDLEILKNFLSK